MKILLLLKIIILIYKLLHIFFLFIIVIMENYITTLNKYITLDMLKNLSIDTSPYNSSNSETGFKGVYKHKDKFRVQLINNYKNYNLGVYDTKLLAAKKYAMTNLLLKNTMKGGVSFNIGNSETKCKKIRL